MSPKDSPFTGSLNTSKNMNIDLKLVTRENFFSHLNSEEKFWQDNYLAMYSTMIKGYVTDPALMVLPVDDHLVHRGDGVFDVMRCVNNRIFRMEPHLKRLENSFKAICLEPPPEYNDIRKIIKAMIIKGGEKNCLIRTVISRGPGGFSTNPFECPSSQMYVNINRFHSLPDDDYKKGIPVITSSVPVKESFFATIKSCNYLHNVLMKMEAIKSGHDYSIALDDEGFLAEGSTENIGIVSEDGIMKIPGFEKTLAGTTASRIFELADILVKENYLDGVQFARISQDELFRSREVMLMGTSLNVLPVVKFDSRPIGKGSPGPVCKRLSELLWKDMTENKDQLTEVE